jgi:cytidine deaminase
MLAGDELRKNSEHNDGVASAILTSIREEREKPNKDDRPICFIIDSLKNPKEVAVLDQVYGRNYYTVAVYAPLSSRRENLANKIARSIHQAVEKPHFDAADILISKDEKGVGDHGQSVRETFPRADFFIDTADPETDVSQQIKRFIELVFGEPFTTPTIDEYMMFVAKATALRSCDLSRQVGAVLVDKNSAIISSGCNEVPVPGGGFFFEGRKDTIEDNRDKVEQHDPNFNEIKRSISELLDVMQQAGLVSKDQTAADLAEQLIHGEHKELTAEARIRNLIEFGRVVHAEMHALAQAAMVGRSVKDATLYCTTYPCHICARHIIAAGVREVVYIEPYPKSLTATLYHREIISERDGTVAESTSDKLVRFRPFMGISPSIYQRVFKHRRRKDSYGAVENWDPSQSSPVGASAEVVRPQFEAFVANQLEEVLTKIHGARAEAEGTSDDETGKSAAAE